MVFDELLEFLDVFQLKLGFEYSLNVTKVFFASTFFVKNQLPENDVFRRGNVDRPLRRLFDEFVPPGPRQRGVAVSGVEVGFQSCGYVDEVEVPAAVSGDFGDDEVGGRTIKFRSRKKRC